MRSTSSTRPPSPSPRNCLSPRCAGARGRPRSRPQEGPPMAVTMQDVSSAMAELGRLRFGEMKVEDAMHEIVRSTHAIFDVDGAGLMLADADHDLHNVAVSD